MTRCAAVAALLLLSAVGSQGLSSNDRAAAALVDISKAPVDQVVDVAFCGTVPESCTALGDAGAQCDTTAARCVCSPGYTGAVCVGETAFVRLFFFVVFALAECAAFQPGTETYTAFRSVIETALGLTDALQSLDVFCGSAILIAEVVVPAADEVRILETIGSAIVEEADARSSVTKYSSGEQTLQMSVQVSSIQPNLTAPVETTPCTTAAQDSISVNGNCIVLRCDTGYIRSRTVVDSKDTYTCELPTPPTDGNDGMSDIHFAIFALAGAVFLGLVVCLVWCLCVKKKDDENKPPRVIDQWYEDDMRTNSGGSDRQNQDVVCSPTHHAPFPQRSARGVAPPTSRTPSSRGSNNQPTGVASPTHSPYASRTPRSHPSSPGRSGSNHPSTQVSPLPSMLHMSPHPSMSHMSQYPSQHPSVSRMSNSHQRMQLSQSSVSTDVDALV